MTHSRAVVIVRVGESECANRIGTTKLKAEEPSTFEVAYDVDCSIPMLRKVAVENRCKELIAKAISRYVLITR